MKKVKIDIHEWTSECGDKCCFNYGTSVTVNGSRLFGENSDYESILVKVLEHLGYEVELNVKIDEDF